jgi:hypothetical protein
MQQFTGCGAHKKFSVFVAVIERGQAGEALRVAHDRQSDARSSDFMRSDRLLVASDAAQRHPSHANLTALWWSLGGQSHANR